MPATAHASSQALVAQMGLRDGEPVTLDAGRRRPPRVCIGRGEFERVEVEVRDVDGEREVVVTPTEADWARSRLRLGIELVQRLRRRQPLHGQRVCMCCRGSTAGAPSCARVARIGSERSSRHPALAAARAGLGSWYVTPSLQYDVVIADVYDQGRRALRVGFDVTTATLALGRQLSNWGDVQLGVDRRVGHGALLVAPGDTELPQRPSTRPRLFAQISARHARLAGAARAAGGLLVGRW